MARITHHRTEQPNGLVVAPTSDWPANEVAAATKTAARLSALARGVVEGGAIPASCHGPDDCRLQDGTYERVCDVARLLAASRSAQALPPVAPPADAELACRRFLDALARAGTAVYVCRRVLHTTGECLFGDDGEGHDLCGRVLAAAHRLGGLTDR